MLQLINDLPPHVAGIHAFADVTESEYTETLIPIFEDQLKKQKKINFVIVLETQIRNFAAGKWCGNVKIGLKYFFRWNRLAIVSDDKSLCGFSHLFEYILPGKYRKFPLDQLDIAIRWISEK